MTMKTGVDKMHKPNTTNLANANIAKTNQQHFCVVKEFEPRCVGQLTSFPGLKIPL